MNGPRCTEMVYSDVARHEYPCARKAVVDGRWCKQHAPEAVAKRRKEASDRYEHTRAHESRMRAAWGLREATDDALLAEVARRGLIAERREPTP